jgi:hypothetical protein
MLCKHCQPVNMAGPHWATEARGKAFHTTRRPHFVLQPCDLDTTIAICHVKRDDFCVANAFRRLSVTPPVDVFTACVNYTTVAPYLKLFL